MDRPEGNAAAPSRWTRDPGTLWREADPDTVLLLAPDGDTPVELRGSAAALWAHLAEPRSGRELAHELARTYRTDPDTVATDIEPLLRELASQRAVRRTT